MPPLQIVLVAPKIPPNVGNVARTCAVTGCRLHLVGPLGFSLDDRRLCRAGLDYWTDLAPELYRDWTEFAARALGGEPGSPPPGGAPLRGPLGGRPPGRPAGRRLHLFTARAGRSAFETAFAPGDLLVFGEEQLGLPPALLDAWPERQVGIPMLPGKRSLNLAVAVGVAVYAALGNLSAASASPQAPS